MSSSISTVTSKWQVTIPEEVRKELPLKIGQRIVWEIQGDALVGRRVRSIRELAGCLKSETRGNDEGSLGEFGKAAVRRHDRIHKQKP